LATLDLFNFDINNVPMTKTKKIMIELSQDPCLVFIQSLTIGELCDLVDRINSKNVTLVISFDYRQAIENDVFNGFVQLMHLFHVYQEWFKEHYSRSKVIKEGYRNFAIKIKEYCAFKKTSSANVYKLHIWNEITSFKLNLKKYNEDKKVVEAECQTIEI
jgi:hypothetical protein